MGVKVFAQSPRTKSKWEGAEAEDRLGLSSKLGTMLRIELGIRPGAKEEIGIGN